MAESGITTSRMDASGLTFRGGMAGALAPFAVFLAGVAWLALAGAPDERGFWPVLVGALSVGLLLARDRQRYSDTLLAGMARPIVMLMVLAWLLAGVLAALLGAGGFVEALVWAARRVGLEGGGYVAMTFLACGLVSTSTGTSFGTILICGPLLYPAGAAVGAHPAFLIGAILGGANFGDSISPISDTTIASAGTQQADIGGVVRARFKYVAPAALVALAVAFVFGAADVRAGAASAGITGSPAGLPMAVVPVLVIGLLLARRHLIEGLLAGAVAAIAIGLPLGLLTPGQLLRVEPGSYTAKSLIIDGLERGIGVSVFTLLLVGLVAALEATGALGRLVDVVRGRGAGPRGAEAWITGVVTGAVLLTTHSVVAILAVGEFARETGTRAGLSAYRRANLLDVTVCTVPFLLPYFLPTLLAASATASGVAFGMPRLSALSAGVHNVYSWALAAMVVFAVTSGYGRSEGAGSVAEITEDDE